MGINSKEERRSIWTNNFLIGKTY